MEVQHEHWVAFWVIFGILAVLPVRPIFFPLFCGLLIFMRTAENHMPQHLWVALWLSLLLTYDFMAVIIGTELHTSVALISLTVRYFVTSSYEMPAPTFWILLAVLLPFILRPSVGDVVYFHVLIYNLHLTFDGIKLPGLLISWVFLMALLAIIVLSINMIAYPKYIPALVLWLAFVGLLHDQMWPFNKDFGLLWIGAWFLSFHAFLFAFSPDMPVLWYVMWASIVVGLWFGYRPGESLGGFVLWSVTVILLRIFLFIIYVLYFVNTDRADLFPFNLFSREWGLAGRRWYPLSSRSLDSLNNKSLCKRCDALTIQSRLILGPSLPWKRLVEWHSFWNRGELVARFEKRAVGQGGAGQASSQPESSCRLCCLLWYSMSPQRRNKMIEGVRLTQSTDNGHADDLLNPKSRKRSCRSSSSGASRPSVPGFWFTGTSSLPLAREWLKMCRDGHKLCCGVGNTKLTLPARMLYVAGGKDWAYGNPPETLKLVETTGMNPGTEYLALSHCWGPPTEMKFKLLASNIDACFVSINFAELSQNMQDAIACTIRLGFSYIWIDSLCIIQKGDEGQDACEDADRWKADWETEAKKMGSVYSSAALTIASTASPSSACGCFHERSLASLGACKIGVSSPVALSPSWIYARRDDVFDFERGVDLAPLNTRGWVMQERLLSRRILHFGADMIFWECCLRSASELNPNGYTYKSFPDDFEDNYTPDLRSTISTRGEMQAAERSGRGISWATKENVRRRPPAVMIDPDAPPNSQVEWQRKRGFWKNVLKPNAESWSKDEQGESSGHARAGFRAAFEQLRGGQSHEAAGESFSQLWYDVVESYSRRRLTDPMDKLIALKGVEDEVARGRSLTYLRGLWKEHLSKDLLWFAIEGPGRRLLNEDGVPVAPTWSWASIEGAVALDLLPETSLTKIEETQELVSIGDVQLSNDDPGSMTISLTGPLLPISAPVSDGTSTWSIIIGDGKRASARFFPDAKESDTCQMTGLACMSFLVLDREKRKSLIPSSREDVQGLVLRFVKHSEPDGAQVDTYERVGYFTTSYMAKSRAAKQGRKALKAAPMTTVCLTGWAKTRD
ncbi:heterokaryon incompatibility protein-domain-containing protein [Stachybotrys elegans]|uniref:Heterokaryon incompatibility protein-domain-containing protein n=1 Tax=Stachybotrys elegans TaxID=80388 RepID=A0A8K0T498_9HYPO|nr:heterokaryon incompatibility protein-domain-containing protein [Stachybotrys elegans]